MAYCSKCGNQINDTALFCNKCGNKLNFNNNVNNMVPNKNLIKCRDCGKMVSRSAKSCPSCGRKQTQYDMYGDTKESVLSLLACITAIFGIGILLGIIDLAIGDKCYGHKGSWIAIGWLGCLIFLLIIYPAIISNIRY